MSDFRLLALDLDGTLLNSALKLSDRNAEAVRRAIAADVSVVLATSRWYLLAKRTADRLGISDVPIVCNNGAVVRRADDGGELLRLRLDPDVALQVTTLADDRGWEFFTTIGDTTYMRARPGVVPDRLPAGLRVAQRQSEVVSREPPTAVLLFGREAVDEIAHRVLPDNDHRARFSLNRPLGLPPYVVLTHPDADKGRALELVCRELHVPLAEALAMGDSESDLSMIEAAGLGIAMDNSPDAVKRAALHIAPANDADGVAWAIERFVL